MKTARMSVGFVTLVAWPALLISAPPDGNSPRPFWSPSAPVASVARFAPAAVPQVESLPPTPADVAAPAGSTRGYSLADLESLALQNNPSLVQAGARIRSANGKWVQDGLYPNPTLMYKGDDIGNEGTAGKQGGSIVQQIVTGNKRQLSQNAAAHVVQQAEQDFAAQQFRVRNDVRLQFSAVLLSQRNVELNKTLREIAEAGAKAANDLFRAQEVSRIDVLQAKVELEAALIQFDKAHNTQLAAWRRLAAVVGVADLQPAPLTGDLNLAARQFGWEESVQRILASSPELSAARSRVQAASWAVQRAYAERHPNFEVEAGAQRDNTTGDNIAVVNVAIPLPLFNRNQGNIQAAEGDLQSAQADVERVSFDLRRRLAGVYERYANAHQQVERYQQRMLPSAKESLELVTKGYRAGELNVLSLLTSQRTYAQAQSAYLDSLRELQETSVLLEGMLLMDSLSSGVGSGN